MKLFDAHVHLQDERLVQLLDQALASARATGVAGFACCGTSEDDWTDVLRIATANADVRASYGLHPWYAGERSFDWEPAMRRLLQEDPRAGVGEIGLDHALDKDTWDEQEQVFKAQLAIARELDRPTSIHCRRAWGTMVAVLSKMGPLPAFVIHSYSGAREQIEAIVEMGGYISFSGSVTLSGNKRAHRNVPLVPLDRLLIETDAPDLPPVIDGNRDIESPNMPGNLAYVLRKVAELRGMTEEEVAEATWENAERVFQA